jgi:hypothetical protein
MARTRKHGPYRITGLHPWPSAGPADVLVEILSPLRPGLRELCEGAEHPGRA